MIETANILGESIFEALETMAFMTTMSSDEEPSVPTNLILGELEFSGPKKGCVQILAGRDFCEVLAENIAALDEADDEACFDAIQELSNVTCGLVIPHLTESDQDTFTVSVPVVKSGSDTPQWEEFIAKPAAHVFSIEEFQIAARLVIE